MPDASDRAFFDALKNEVWFAICGPEVAELLSHGERLAHARRWFGLAIERIAEESGVPPSVIVAWEAGKKVPSRDDRVAVISAVFWRRGPAWDHGSAGGVR